MLEKRCIVADLMNFGPLESSSSSSSPESGSLGKFTWGIGTVILTLPRARPSSGQDGMVPSWACIVMLVFHPFPY